LATVFLRLNQFEQAHSALQQALKNKYGDWKIWSNFLYTSLHVKDLHNAIIALAKVVKMRGEKCFDENVLFEFVEYARKQATNGVNIDIYKLQIEKCFETVTQKIANNPRVWEAYAFYYDTMAQLSFDKFEKQKNVDALVEAIANMELLIEKRTKQVRNLQIRYAKNLIIINFEQWMGA
jgi:tetratricopeptide (TPR) repeat protein